jgi:hypothetical protein
MSPDLSAEFHLSSSALPLIGLAAVISDTRLELDEVIQTDGETVLLCWFGTDSFDPVEAALDAEASITEVRGESPRLQSWDESDRGLIHRPI